MFIFRWGRNALHFPKNARTGARKSLFGNNLWFYLHRKAVFRKPLLHKDLRLFSESAGMLCFRRKNISFYPARSLIGALRVLFSGACCVGHLLPASAVPGQALVAAKGF